MDEVYMNVPKVEEFAKTFDSISDVLKTVSKVLEALVNTLKATAFIGAVGGLAVIHFIETVKPYIDEMAEKCAELCKDLKTSIEAYQRGDATGATRFH
jgi:uncharacterized protein Yka (UPF0111/DUF47 family)